ncbi:MAG: short-chain dehydrogenase/reductase, partial [Cellvibrio sp.]|nr:short-chain dehydrogenase/reductase [Cellvibrio sp.]
MKLQDRTILITGGTSGIGKALVKHLAPHNKTIVVIARNPIKMEKLSEEFPNVKTYRCSLSNKLEVESTLSEITDNHP